MNTDIYGSLITAMVILLVSAVTVPFLAKKRKLAGWLNFLLVFIAGAILLTVSYRVIFDSLYQSSRFVEFGPVGLYFLVDSFSAFFIAIIAFMAIISAYYSIEYMEHYPDYSLKSYYACYPLFILGMIGVVTVDDLSLGFTIAWQLMTIASYFLVKFEFKKKENVKSANKYLILMELAWVAVLGGVFLIGDFTMGESLHHLIEKLGSVTDAKLYVIYGLILFGFGMKAGVFPLGQLWLPDAHSIAPSPISALLSGVMLKTGIYGIIRTFYWMVPHGGDAHFNGVLWGAIIAGMGVVTLFIGTAQSMKQSDSKRLLAYSSIGQLGYIIFGIGSALVMFNSNNQYIQLLGLVAIIGVVYHILNHAVFKGLLFLTSGSVLYATGTKDLNKLGGLMKLMPISCVVAGIAALSISGVPPFSGFMSKWTIISTSLLAGKDAVFLVLFGIIALFTSALTLSCYVKFFGMTFTSSGVEWNTEKKVKEVPAGMLIPKLVLTVLCLVQGLIPFFYFDAIIGIFQKSKGSIVYQAFNSVNFSEHIFSNYMGVSVSVPGVQGITNLVAVPVILLIVFALAMLLGKFLRSSAGSEERESPTWLCGYQDLNNNNRFIDRNMFAALKKALRWTGGNGKQ
ncbi:MAG: hypothetical protein GY754_00975 [bacterium]|nr:hypothetical protein [bacterium]